MLVGSQSLSWLATICAKLLLCQGALVSSKTSDTVMAGRERSGEIVMSPDEYNSYKRLSRTAHRMISDIDIISYPKCGRTWLKTMLMAAADPFTRKLLFTNDTGIIHAILRGSYLRGAHGEHFHRHPFYSWPSQLTQRFKTFTQNISDPFIPYQPWFFRKVVILIRDPLDVLVSSYFERVYRHFRWQAGINLPKNTTLDDFASLDLKQKGSLSTYVAFLNVWTPVALRYPNKVLLVHYESLHDCPVHVLSKVLNSFLGLDVPCDALQDAVQGTSFERMRDAASKSDHSIVGYADPKNPDSAKIRRGNMHVAHEILSPRALAAARRALNALHPDVRAEFRGRAKACYVLGTEDEINDAHEPPSKDLACPMR
eukprot:TRINITY_DN110369_c0_g1_i1.p1 TRINITY_DN110369_c0_g1~~TRINITY_DN110369_c0_g1_i1.p1  ORF type:complete len:370 (-),score=39.50 TRINITY_DN110369_c0_g1_i1:5-1114(-)